MDFELSEELKMVQGLARDFVRERLKPLERDVLGRSADLSDARACLPAEKETALIALAKEAGLWGIGVPEGLGGAGLGTLGVCLVEEELGAAVVPFRLGDVSPVLFDCNQDQRERYLTPTLNYEKRPYLAFIEPGNSDVLKMKTTAEKADGGYIINGQKLSLSRPSPDFFVVVFASTKKGATCFLVDKDAPGLSIDYCGENTGWLARIREPMKLTFNGCCVEPADVLGEEGGAFRLGTRWLPQRRIVRGARAVGAARRLLEEAATQAQSAAAFGRPVIDRRDIRAALADMAAQVRAARLMVYEAAWRADSGRSIKREGVMLKLFTTQTLRRVADWAAHVFNGPPYIDGLPMELLCRRALEVNLGELSLQRQTDFLAEDVIQGIR